MIDIVARINELLERKGWTGYELSKQTGISTNAIYDWNRIGAMPTLANVVKICEAMGITTEQFFCSDEGYGMTDDERKILQEWFMLGDLEKDAVLKMIETFKILKRK
jgi:transcriptional regulator with XRE-family HTH domain